MLLALCGFRGLLAGAGATAGGPGFAILFCRRPMHAVVAAAAAAAAGTAIDVPGAAAALVLAVQSAAELADLQPGEDVQSLLPLVQFPFCSTQLGSTCPLQLACGDFCWRSRKHTGAKSDRICIDI